MTPGQPNIRFRDTQEAFEKAIVDRRLSDNPDAENYAGLYMYMGTQEDGFDLFKHRETRRYLS